MEVAEELRVIHRGDGVRDGHHGPTLRLANLLGAS
jgi:hypothetical protein